MSRAVVPVITAALTVLACSEDPVQPNVTGPLFQVGEGRTECTGGFTAQPTTSSFRPESIAKWSARK